MAESMPVLVDLGFKLTLVVVGFAYGTAVLITYITVGPNFRPRLDGQNLGASLKGILVWIGVKSLAGVLTALRRLFSLLYEASAEIGLWFLSRRDTTARATIRSPFQH